MRLLFTLMLLAGVAEGQLPSAAPGGRAGGRGGGRGGAATMTVTTAWPDGGVIPARYTQMAGEISPGVQWSGAPAGTTSFVLLFHDADTVLPNSLDGILHWMLWNIPGTAASIAPGRPDGFEWEDGTRQLSVSGSRYRGPGAPAAGPLHHYVMEIYALDTMLDVKVGPQGPQDANPNVQEIRAALLKAMLGHVRGKGACVGLFHRPQ